MFFLQNVACVMCVQHSSKNGWEIILITQPTIDLNGGHSRPQGQENEEQLDFSLWVHQLIYRQTIHFIITYDKPVKSLRPTGRR